MLCIAGLDIAIVGHYDYLQTGYYSIATLPTNFMLTIVGCMLGPLMPATSAMSTECTPAEMGAILAKTTRYSTLILLLIGLPLIVFGLLILRPWVGSSYASQSIGYLRILVLANIIRNLCAPYATMIVATNRQAPATAAAISEGFVNLAASILLASRFGAIGVAVGTLIGSLVSVSLHFGITMHYTFGSLQISRSQLFVVGLIRPAIIAIPSVLVLLACRSLPRTDLSASWLIAWATATVALAWFGALTVDERNAVGSMVRNRWFQPPITMCRKQTSGL